MMLFVGLMVLQANADCLKQDSNNCKGAADYIVEKPGNDGDCIEFSDFNGPCDMEIQASLDTENSGCPCWFPQGDDVAVTIFKQGGDSLELTRGQGSLSVTAHSIPDGYNSMQVTNLHSGGVECCKVKMSGFSYCCKSSASEKALKGNVTFV